VRELLLVLFTWKAGFACTDAAFFLKLQDKGFSKESITYLRTIMSPIEFVMPILASHYTTGPRPLDLAMWQYVPRLLLGAVACGLVAYTPEEIGWEFTAVVMLFMAVHSAMSTSMFTAQMAFFARVSDPEIGGSYMTLLNTFANLGYLWTTMVATRLVDMLTVKSEDGEVEIDGFYATSMLTLGLGLIWFVLMRHRVESIQVAHMSSWRVAAIRRGRATSTL